MKLPLLALLLFVLAASFGATDVDPSPGPLERLQAIWRHDLSKRAAFKPHNKQLAQQLFDVKRVMVHDIAGEEAFKRIDGTLQPSERSLILIGDLSALRKHAKVTEIHNPGTFRNGFSAYVAPDGKLLLLWIIPEG